jgi:hypothetical protein
VATTSFLCLVVGGQWPVVLSLICLVLSLVLSCHWRGWRGRSSHDNVDDDVVDTTLLRLECYEYKSVYFGRDFWYCLCFSTRFCCDHFLKCGKVL